MIKEITILIYYDNAYIQEQENVQSTTLRKNIENFQSNSKTPAVFPNGIPESIRST